MIKTFLFIILPNLFLVSGDANASVSSSVTGAPSGSSDRTSSRLDTASDVGRSEEEPSGGADPVRDDENSEDAEKEESDLQLSWEVLELARIICTRYIHP